MPKRKLRVVKRINNAPSLAICESCNTQFPVPSYLTGQREKTQAAIESDFEKHKCKPEDASQAVDRESYIQLAICSSCPLSNCENRWTLYRVGSPDNRHGATLWCANMWCGLKLVG